MLCVKPLGSEDDLLALSSPPFLPWSSPFPGNPWPGLPRSPSTLDATIIPGTASAAPYGSVSPYNFTVVDYSSPFIVGYQPAMASLGVAKSDPVMLTFNEDIQLGSLNDEFVLTPSGGNGVDQSTYPYCPLPVAYSFLVADATQAHPESQP